MAKPFNIKVQKIEIFHKIFIILALLFCFVPFLSVTAPLRISDLGIYSILFYILFILFIIFSSKGKLKIKVFVIIIVIFIAFAIVNILRIVNYHETLSVFYSNRAPIAFLIYWLFCFEGFKNPDAKFIDDIKRMIIINAVIQAVFGIIHNLVFPDVIIGQRGLADIHLLDGYLDASKNNRETGLLINATTYANIILLGLIVISYDLYLGKSKKIFQSYLLICLFFCAILLSKSRYPLLFTVLFVLIGFIRKIDAKKMIIIFISLVIAFSVGFSIYKTYFYRGYFAEDRMLKLNIALSIIKQSPLYLLIGAPTNIIASTMAPNASKVGKIFFSDNSYFAIVLSMGLPFLIFWSYVLYKKFSFIIPNRFISLFLIYVLGCLFVTNSYYYEQWILLSMILFFYLNIQKIDNNYLKKANKSDLRG